jgi:hypothetical protein
MPVMDSVDFIDKYTRKNCPAPSADYAVASESKQQKSYLGVAPAGAEPDAYR